MAVTTVLVLAVLWVVVGVPAIVGVIRERRAPDVHFSRAMGALGATPVPPTGRRRLGHQVSVAQRRHQVTAAIYLTAFLTTTAGVAMGSRPVLASGVLLVNLGTVYRIVVLRLRAVAAQRQRSSGPVVPNSPAALASLPPGPIEPGYPTAASESWRIVTPEEAARRAEDDLPSDGAERDRDAEPEVLIG